MLYNHYKSKLENFNANAENQASIKTLGHSGVMVEVEENTDGGLIGTITCRTDGLICNFFDQRMFECFMAGWHAAPRE